MLTVPGEAEFLARRVTEWLRREARRDLERAVARHAEALGKTPRGDPRRRRQEPLGLLLLARAC